MKITAGRSRPLRMRTEKGALRWPAWTLAAVPPLSGLLLLLLGSFDGRVLDFPIRLEPGVIWEARFRVTRGVRHVVLLEVDNTIPRRSLECLMGGTFRDPCDIDPAVDLLWRLSSGSQEIASGDASLGVPHGGPTSTTMLIGQFKASFGRAYVLELASRTDGSALAATNPRVVVQFHPEVNKGFVIFAPLIAFATALASLPLLVMASGVLVGRRHR